MTRPIHVLHVDDEPALRDLTAEFLERVSSAITVHSVADPTDVPAELEASDIDCVVSDYEMPEQNGLDLCCAVREEHPELPFFLFTSRGGEEIISRAMVAGATDYIQKEPGVEQYTLLANRIDNAVSRHRLAERIDELERAVDDRAVADGGAVGETDGGTVADRTVATDDVGAADAAAPADDVEFEVVRGPDAEPFGSLDD
jgi:DNA-binding NtrC family response regulator